MESQQNEIIKKTKQQIYYEKNKETILKKYHDRYKLNSEKYKKYQHEYSNKENINLVAQFARFPRQPDLHNRAARVPIFDARFTLRTFNGINDHPSNRWAIIKSSKSFANRYDIWLRFLEFRSFILLSFKPGFPQYVDILFWFVFLSLARRKLAQFPRQPDLHDRAARVPIFDARRARSRRS